MATKSSSKSLKRLFILAGLLSAFAARTNAQESSSQGQTEAARPATTAIGPAAALRDLLLSACSQSQQEFVRLLTARNKESFERLSAVARVAFMKRFVLLNEPGKASATTSPAGRPTVHCATPDVTTEMQIGGAEVRENLAFLPVELRDATDATGVTVRRVTLGLVRESGEWKLLSLGLLLLDLPSLETEWDQAEISPNETGALEALKKIAGAIETYRKLYTRLPESLSNLGPAHAGQASGQTANLLDSDLATGTKNGYGFRYVIVGANSLGAQAKYELSATPAAYGRTGIRSFFRDAGGGLHAADRQGAVGNEIDPKVK